MDLRPGALIAGRYRVERKVGAGGMGEVWAGEHVAIGVRVALKKLLPAAAVDHQVVARFKREAYLLGRIRSDHVARVVDFIADNRFGLVLVMDFVEGELLTHMLQARRLSVEETLELGVDIAEALCDLSRASIVHRDLKPDNIIMEPREGGRRRAVLVDFGVSRLLSGDGDHDEDITGITHADMAVGTIAYMAPEQLLSSRDVTASSDVYALGAILYRAVAGQHVFGDTDDIDYAKTKLSCEADPLELPRIDRVARGLTALVARALQRRPEARFESAAAMLAELTTLRDLARAMSLDLEGTTEDAILSAEVVRASTPGHLPSTAPTPLRVKVVMRSGPVDPSSATLPSFDGAAALKAAPLPKIEMPAAAPENESIFDEVTTLNTSRGLGPLPQLESPAPPAAAPMAEEKPAEEAKKSAEKVAIAPASARRAISIGEIDPTAIPRGKVLVAVVVALVGGVALGALLHWGISASGEAAPAPPRPSASAIAPRRR